MKLEVSDFAGWSGKLVTVSGELGFSEVTELKGRLDEVLKGDAQAILLDLGGMSFVASDGLGVLIRARAHAEQLGKKFALVRPQERIFDLLKKTWLTKIFTIHATMEEATRFTREE